MAFPSHDIPNMPAKQALFLDLLDLPCNVAGLYVHVLYAAWRDPDCLVRNHERRVEVISVNDPDLRDGDVQSQIGEFFEVTDQGWLFGYNSRSSDHVDWMFHSSRIMDERWARIRAQVMKARKHVCLYCGTTDGPFEIDHMLPRSRGGTHCLKNLAVACEGCNRRKGAMTAAEFRQLSRQATKGHANG